jgi:hemolysin activation/secretion protein
MNVTRYGGLLLVTSVATGLACPARADQADPLAQSAATLAREAQTLENKRQNMPEAEILTLPESETVSVEAISDGSILIGAVTVTGASELGPHSFADVIESHIGQQANAAELQKLARAIADRARDRGYIFASAIVPAQAVDMGVVRVEIDEGHVDEVRIHGDHSKRLKRMLDQLAGKAVSREKLERVLKLASDLPGVAIRNTRFVREGKRGILHVATSRDRVALRLSADNYGSDSIGPVRARLAFDFTDLIGDGDNLSVLTVTSPFQPRELVYVTTRYSRLIGDEGLEVTLSASAGRTRPDNGPAFPAIIGNSQILSAQISYPLVRSNDTNLWLSGEMAYLTVEQDIVSIATVRDDIVTFTASAWGNIRLVGGRLSGGVNVTRGLDWLGATRDDEFLVSRDDGSGQFTKGVAWFSWQGPLAKALSLRVAGMGQVASRALLSPQEMGLGGPGFGRGFNFSERFGDQGVAGMVELRRQFRNPVKGVNWAQLYGFVDGGYVMNLSDGYGGGALVSAGGGLRAGIGKLELGAELAMPINTIRYEAGKKSPRVNLSVGYGI